MTRGKGRKPQKRGAFGTAHKLPSGRWRAMYRGPGARRYSAPKTFLTEKDARGWRQSEIIRKAWVPPEADEMPLPKLIFEAYSKTWMAQRDLKDRTREHYDKLLEDHIVPTFGALPIASITADDVRAWHAKIGTKTPTLRAHCYGLLRTIMGTALSDGKIKVNPCVIRGAGSFLVTTPKSDAGRRDVEIPPHLLPAVKDHLARFVGPENGALLFRPPTATT